MKTHPDDGKFVVVKGGQRISELHADERTAVTEATNLNKVQEAAGQPSGQPEGKFEVKQNLLG